jgi:hypothetical protein
LNQTKSVSNNSQQNSNYQTTTPAAARNNDQPKMPSNVNSLHQFDSAETAKNTTTSYFSRVNSNRQSIVKNENQLWSSNANKNYTSNPAFDNTYKYF